MKHIAGVYTGALSGISEVSIFYLQHRFKVQGTWKLDLGETSVKIVIKGLPVVDRITGAGTVDPHTGFMEMVVKTPVTGKLRGTGRFDGGNYAFHIPRVDYSMSGTLTANGSASGNWEFNISFIVFRLSGKGDLFPA